MAAIGTIIDRRRIITTVCYVELAVTPADYVWVCLTHGESGAEPSPLALMQWALGHTNAHINDDQN
jgi:hypothetical protein